MYNPGSLSKIGQVSGECNILHTHRLYRLDKEVVNPYWYWVCGEKM